MNVKKKVIRSNRCLFERCKSYNRKLAIMFSKEKWQKGEAKRKKIANSKLQPKKKERKNIAKYTKVSRAIV